MIVVVAVVGLLILMPPGAHLRNGARKPRFRTLQVQDHRVSQIGTDCAR
jgi:hypothetical protein